MLRICVIGAGDRGTAHAGAWAARDDATVVAVCDIDEARASRLASAHGAAAYAKFDEALDHGEIDAVSVCVPTYLHAPVIEAAAERGCHVMAEKPLALTVEQGESIARAVAQAGVVYSACFQHRDRGLFSLQRKFFRDGRIGSPVHFSFSDVREVRPKTAMHRQSMNGGVVIDMACHMFDMLRYITGAEIVRVYASGHVFGTGKPSLAAFDDLAIDAASIEVETDAGHLGSFYINWGMPDAYRAPANGASLVGPLGGVYADGGSVVLDTGDHRELWPGEEPGMRLRLERFVAAVTEGASLDVGYRDARIALDLSHAALESIRTREPVVYEPYSG